MSKFKVGDKVVRVCQEGGAKDVLVGQVYTIAEIHEEFVRVEGSDGWLCDFRFALPVKEEGEMTAEKIRNEILRIDTRIEEAKKDIENAEKERDSLVEKLREKGFEMIKVDKSSVHRFNVGDIVEVIGYSPERHTISHIGRKGVIEKVDNSEIPFKVILEREDEDSNTWFQVNQIKKI